MELFTITTLIVAIIVDASLLISLFCNRLHGAKKYLALHIFGVLCWAVSVLMLLETGSEFVTSCAYASALVLSFAKYLFALSFTKQNLAQKKSLYVYSLVTLFFVIASFIPDLLFTNVQIIDGYYVKLDDGPLAAGYAAIVTLFLVAPIITLHRAYKQAPEGPFRQQLTYLTRGVSLFFIVGLATNSILPVFFNFYNLNGFGPVFSIVLAGYIVYIIAAFQFLNLRIFIQRSLVYTILLLFIVFIYGSALVVFTTLLDAYLQIGTFAAGITSIVIAVITVPDLDKALRRSTDRIFFKGTYNYEQTLHELSMILFETESATTLLRKSEQKLCEIMRAEFVQIRKHAAAPSDTVLTLPIQVQNKQAAVMYIGTKRSGQNYTAQDILLLKTFVNQASISLSRALLYKEIETKAAELEERVTERTQELKESQALQKKVILEISHNLQTPLAVLQTKIESLKKKVSLDEVAQLELSLRTTSEYINDLLRFTRLEGRHEKIQKSKTNLSYLLSEIAEEVTIIAETRNITITATIEPDVTALIDAKKIREAILNLLSNAIKYIPEESLVRTIDIYLTRNDTTATVSISDSGTGVQKKDLGNIFKPFFRSERHKSVAGTGLGLAIVKEIVAQHDGTVTVKSKPAKGSTFIVELPIR